MRTPASRAEALLGPRVTRIRRLGLAAQIGAQVAAVGVPLGGGMAMGMMTKDEIKGW